MLLDLLVKKRLLSAVQKTELDALNCSSASEALISSGLFSSNQLAVTLGELFQEPVQSIHDFEYDAPELLKFKRLALKHQALPLEIKRNELLLAVSDPSCLEIQNDFRFSTQLKIKIALVDHLQLAGVIRKLYGQALTNPTRSSILTDLDVSALSEVADLDDIANADEAITDDAPVSRYIQQVLLDASQKHASDIHFEPFEHNYQIRFRLDGILRRYSSPPAGIARRISARIKILAKLNIAERRLPQDGRLKLTLNDNSAIDMRVSTIPTLWGEKIVLRLLGSGNNRLSINELGLTQTQHQHFLRALDTPQGMILITGPTGSGKTVSLYAGLEYLNTLSRNISTAEDPVEINISGINQVNINPNVGLHFATTLRALLRQDPDIIMVGEVRDVETAEIAIKAAQTGHMVLSTLHTNSAAESITRLANMGIAYYNLAASLTLIIAQRLVRQLCIHCKKPHQDDSILQSIAQRYPSLSPTSLYQANDAGCDHCNYGYAGRVGIYEILPIDDVLISAISRGANTQEIEQISRSNGILNLQQAGIEKLNLGVTSLKELQRVVNL